MTPIERHRKMTDLFDRAMGLPAEQREPFVRAECIDDPDLVQSMLRMLEAEAANTIDAGAVVRAAAGSVIEHLSEGPGSRVGPYKILEQIGEGGFGVVFMAEQQEPVVRRVALKVIKLGMDTKQVIARFEAERQALAMMDHPNIARVLDAGATETGRPFFVMELVRGDPITEYCDKNHLDTDERLALFMDVCHAVQHAHQKGIIHRDIKPSNVLVTIFDGRPIPKVIDFGIAKAMHQRLTDKTLFTAHRHLIGTPQYMSPEQAEMSGVDIDTRSDLYSLGVLLYELLTGTTPFDPEQLRSAALAEVQRIIREVEPEKPSTRLSSMARSLPDAAVRRQADPSRLSVAVRGDLDWIVMKCLEKDRTRRYETADGLAADVRRHVDGEPVLAAPPSRAYRVRKFLRRNRGPATAGAAIGAALLIGMVATGTFAWREAAARADAEQRRKDADQARAEAEGRRKETEQIAGFQAEMLSKVNPIQTGAELLRDLQVRLEAAMIRGNVPEAERTERATAFGDALAMINGTDAAASVLDRAILQPALQAVDEQFHDQPATKATLLQTLADAHARLGLYTAAEPLQKRALDLRRMVLGNDDPTTLESVYSSAILLANLGRATEALALTEEVLQHRRRVGGEEDPETIACEVEQFNLKWLQSGHAVEAEPQVRALLERAQRRLGEEHPYTLAAESALAILLVDIPKLEEAEQIDRRLVEAYRRTLGDDDPKTVVAINNLGVALQRQGRPAEAEPFLKEAVERGRRVHGEDHPDTLLQVNNYVIVLKDLGRLREAEQLRRDVLERRRKVLGPLHPATLDSMGKLGLMLNELGRAAEAEPLLREALEGQRRVLGERNADTLNTMNNLGSALLAMGRFGEAEPLLRESLESARITLGEDNATTAAFVNAMGTLFFQQLRLIEAEPYTRDALRMARRIWGDDNAQTVRAVWDLGFLLWMQGRQAEAEPFMRELLEKHRRLSGEESPDTLKATLDLGNLLWDLGKLDEAESLTRRVVEARRRLLGDESPETLGALTQLGRVQMARGRLDDAQTCLDEVLRSLPQNSGAEDLATVKAVLGMGELRRLQGRLEDAEPLLLRGIAGYLKGGGENRQGTVNARISLGQVLVAQSRFTEAEDQLLRAESACPHALAVSPARHLECIEQVVALYEAWERADPGKGYDTKRAEWQAKYEALSAPARSDPEERK